MKAGRRRRNDHPEPGPAHRAGTHAFPRSDAPGTGTSMHPDRSAGRASIREEVFLGIGLSSRVDDSAPSVNNVPRDIFSHVMDDSSPFIQAVVSSPSWHLGGRSRRRHPSGLLRTDSKCRAVPSPRGGLLVPFVPCVEAPGEPGPTPPHHPHAPPQTGLPQGFRQPGASSEWSGAVRIRAVLTSAVSSDTMATLAKGSG